MIRAAAVVLLAMILWGALLLGFAHAADSPVDRATTFLKAAGYVDLRDLRVVANIRPCLNTTVHFEGVKADRTQRHEGRVCCNATKCAGPFLDGSYTLATPTPESTP